MLSHGALLRPPQGYLVTLFDQKESGKQATSSEAVELVRKAWASLNPNTPAPVLDSRPIEGSPGALFISQGKLCAICADSLLTLFLTTGSAPRTEHSDPTEIAHFMLEDVKKHATLPPAPHLRRVLPIGEACPAEPAAVKAAAARLLHGRLSEAEEPTAFAVRAEKHGADGSVDVDALVEAVASAVPPKHKARAHSHTGRFNLLC